MKPQTPLHTVLIFRIGSLGDTLVALPAFHLIRECYPDSQIVLLTNTPVNGGMKAAPSHQILMGSGLVDEYIDYPHLNVGLAEFVKLAGVIRKLRPSVSFYLMPVRSVGQRIRDTLFFAAAGLLHVNGLWPGFDGNQHRPVAGRPEQRESEASRLLRSVGFDPARLQQSLFSLSIQPAERASVQSMLHDLGAARRFIALSVGAKVAAKDWGQDRWFELLELLRESYGDHALVFLGSGDEFERCQRLLNIWPSGGRNFCGQLSPRQSAAVLERADLFVGHDSGPMHLASSTGIPSVSIFAARDKPGVWFPFGNEENVFYNLVPCHNCRLSVCVEEQMVCIRTIRPIDVAERINFLLATTEPNNVSDLTHRVLNGTALDTAQREATPT
jgi:ADP-heptose:LPS heptosyltransferase